METPIPPPPPVKLPPLPPITPPPVPQEKKPKKFIFVILLILVMILGAVTAVFGYQYIQTQKQKAKEQTQTQASPLPKQTVPSPSPDPTEGWETYTNEEYGYEFKYPKNWKLSTTSNEFILFSFLLRLEDESQELINTYGGKPLPNPHYPYYSINLNIKEDTSIDFNLESWAKEQSFLIKQQIKIATVSGIKGVRYYTFLVPSSSDTINTSFFKDNKIYTLEYYTDTPSETDQEKFIDVYDQILSTFKFTNENK